MPGDGQKLGKASFNYKGVEMNTVGYARRGALAIIFLCPTCAEKDHASIEDMDELTDGGTPHNKTCAGCKAAI